MAVAGQPCTPLLGDTPGNQAHVKRGPLGAGAGSCPGGRAGGSFTPELPSPCSCARALVYTPQPHSSAFSSEETQQPTGMRGV